VSGNGWGALIARLAVGLLFFLSGRGKLFVPQRREQMRESLVAAGIPFASINAIFVSMVEFVFGLLVILGALTPLACIMLGGVMVVAIVTSATKNIKTPPLLGWLSEFLYLPEVLYLVILSGFFFPALAGSASTVSSSKRASRSQLTISHRDDGLRAGQDRAFTKGFTLESSLACTSIYLAQDD